MNRLLAYILLSFFVLSCNTIDKPKKPDNLISKNKMIDIITDISLVNAAKGVNKKLLEEKGINPENYIFNKYDIDSLQFAQSSNYYAFDVKEYEDIYTRVHQRLEKKKKEYNLLEEKKTKKKDSIIKAKRKKRDSIKDKNKILIQEVKPVNPSKKDHKSPQ